MKTTLKTIIGGAALGLALLANTAPTWAGQKIRAEVHVSNTGAYGTMNGARYSSDNLQQIGCYAYGTTSLASATCYAYDKVGGSRGCITYNPNLVQAVAAITDSSFIGFTIAPGGGECLSLDVNNLSAYLK